MKQGKTRKYPREFDSLQKGDTIPDTLIASICDCKSGDANFGLRRLSVGQMIEGYFKSSGIVVTVAVVKNKLHILSDAEASERNFHRTTLRATGMRRDHRRNLGVDTRKLTPEQLQEHDRHLCRQGQMVLAIRAHREIPIDLIPVKGREPK